MTKFYIRLIACLCLTGWFFNHKASAQQVNFYSLQKAMDKKFKHYKPGLSEKESQESPKDDEYARWKRWEYFMEMRAYPSGIFDASAMMRAYQQQKFSQQKLETPAGITANWTELGPDYVPENGAGVGRINVIAVNPNDSNTIYIGSACGGVWKSTNGGTSWSNMNENLPSMSIADIAINPRHTDSIFIATGDGAGYELGVPFFWGGLYSAGIMLSPDGGETWQLTGLSYLQSDNNIIQCLLMDPNNPNILLASTRNGLKRSADAGQSWTKTTPLHFYKMKFNTADPHVVYAVEATSSNIYGSVDEGLTWKPISNFNASAGSYATLETTKANPNIIFVWVTGSGSQFYKSGDGGNTWQLETSPNITNYGYYSSIIGASQVDSNLVYVGGVGLQQSTNGGKSWVNVGSTDQTNTTGYVHADKHFIGLPSASPKTVYVETDGGLFRSRDNGKTFSNLSNGIGIGQVYRLSSSVQHPYTIFIGKQDNGCENLDGTTWNYVTAADADGMETFVDYTNEITDYVEYQNGYLYRSKNSGTDWTFIQPGGSSGAWVTPYALNPQNHNTIFAGYQDVYKSTSQGDSWTKISNNLVSSTNYPRIQYITIAPQDSQTIYTGQGYNMYKTNDGGTTWNEITNGLPTNVALVSGMCIDPENADHVWVSLSGYSDGNKVYASQDGGQTWTNISGSLPNIPVDCITYQAGSEDGIYIGTDIGVYYIDNTISDWYYYNEGLPAVIVDQLEINYTNRKIRAATYGRGVWESGLYGSATSVTPVAQSGLFKVFPNPASGNLILQVNPNITQTIDVRIDNILGQKVFEKTIAHPGGTTQDFSITNLSNGTYFLTIQMPQKLYQQKIVVQR